VTIIEQAIQIQEIKFAFGKDYLGLNRFSISVGAICMHNPNFGLNILNTLSPENQLRSVFQEILARDGYFLFNLNRVNLTKAVAGFSSYTEAVEMGMITEWELSTLISNEDYLDRTLFHNDLIEIPKIINGIQFLWQ
jgi:hypothetical protein